MKKNELIKEIVDALKEYPTAPGQDDFDEAYDEAIDAKASGSNARALEIIDASGMVGWADESAVYGAAENLEQLAFFALIQMKDNVIKDWDRF